MVERRTLHDCSCAAQLSNTGDARQLGWRDGKPRYHRIVKTVAVIGASPHRHKFGNKAVRAFRDAGYRVVPITPHHSEIEGVRAYATVLEFPEAIDMATMYVPPDIGVQVLDSLAEKGIAEVWFNPGSDAPAVLTRARALGLRPIQACSIIGIGMSPAEF
jgi:predicted CoA-binding protein